MLGKPTHNNFRIITEYLQSITMYSIQPHISCKPESHPSSEADGWLSRADTQLPVRDARQKWAEVFGIQSIPVAKRV